MFPQIPLLIDFGSLGELTPSQVVLFLVFFATLLKALKDIRELGWRPFVKKWFLPWRDRRRKIDEVINKVDSINEKVTRIDSELKVNGGASVKDMICRIADRVEDVGARVRNQDESSPAALFELSNTGGMRFANCSFRELVNADESELMHRDYVSRIQAGDRSRYLQELSESVHNMMPLDSTVHFRVDSRDFVCVRLLATPDVRPGGALKGFFGMATKVEST